MEGKEPEPEDREYWVAVADDWWISRVCEEFQCTPDAAVRQPFDLTNRIMELRAYARAKTDLETAEKEDDVPRTEAVEWVWEVQHRLLKRRIANRKEV